MNHRIAPVVFTRQPREIAGTRWFRIWSHTLLVGVEAARRKLDFLDDFPLCRPPYVGSYKGDED
jgi:hypothetical protein